MARAAAGDTRNLTSFSLAPENLDHRTVTPFYELIRHTDTLHSLELSLTSRARDLPPERLDQIRIVIDHILLAACLNKGLSLKSLEFDIIGNPQLFQRFLVASSTIEYLKVTRYYAPANVPISTEEAQALAGGLRSIDSLKAVTLHFKADSQAAMLVANGLQGRPNIESVHWRWHVTDSLFDEGVLSAVFNLPASCPRLRWLNVSPTGRGIAEHDAAPMLWGLRTNDSFYGLEISTVSVGGGGSTTSFSPNRTLQSLTFEDVTFREDSLPVLQRFKALKEVLFIGCEGFSVGLADVLSDLAELQELEIARISEEENQFFAANISQVVSHGPSAIDFSWCQPVTHEAISGIVSGLSARENPLKKLCLHSFSRSACDEETMDLFFTEALPLLDGIEDLQIFGILRHSSDEEVCRFLGSLSTFENLKKLNLSMLNLTRETAEALVKFVKRHEGIVAVEEFRFAGGLEKAKAKVEFYLQLNRYGRQHLRNRDVPVGLWPILFARIVRVGEKSVLFEFLKTLSTTVDLFKDA